MKDGLTSAAPATADGKSGTTLYEGLSVELVPAPIGKRYLAFAIDMGLITAIMYVVVLAAMVVGGILFGAGFGIGELLRARKSGLETAGLIGLVIFVLVVLLVILVAFDGYFVWFEYRKGTTPGKKLFGMRVVSLRGARLTLGQCLLREAFRILDCMLVFPGIISVVATDRRQRLGDLAAGSMVVYSARREKSEESLYLTPERFAALRERFLPSVPTEDVCSRFLKFAYAELIMRRQTSPSETLDQWDAVARSHFTAGGDFGDADRDTRLLFFAELCFQTMNAHS